MNWLASPFGSQEDLLLTYGLKDQDYTLDDQGQPQANARRRQPRRLRALALRRAAPVGLLPGRPARLRQGLPRSRASDPSARHRRSDQRLLLHTVYAKGAIADMAWQDGVREIILGRTPMTQYDQLVKDWQTAAGDQVRKEYTDAIAASK